MLPDTPKVWLIGVHLIEEPKDPDEVERVEKGAMTAKSLVRSAKNESFLGSDSARPTECPSTPIVATAL